MDLDTQKKKIKEIYNRIGQIWCLRLGRFVKFSSRGFNHFLYKTSKGKSVKRDEADILRRLKLFPYVETVLSDNTAKLAVDRVEVQDGYSIDSHLATLASMPSSDVNLAR